ncbi:hypothetical protein HK099_005108 [Clydaea vesicula]|uniref:Uncharacterized protein n=1 Tax=Clydaea vesicula TaxID=447962 RepID=A0AAD5XV71_9FUNG|nr:hypothetical protein HK099_005108 [Clydaea vesicula]
MIQRATYSFKSEEENEFNLEGYEFIVQVDVPANISLRNLDDNTAPNHFQNFFFIAWVISYALFDSVNNTELVRLTNKNNMPLVVKKLQSIERSYNTTKKRRALVVEVEDDGE